MKNTRHWLASAIYACAMLISVDAGAESATLICMWPDGRPTRVTINYDTRTVTWASNSAPARISDQEILWEIPGETNFSINRRSPKSIRITGVGGLRNATNIYPCTTAAQ
jgi:hypothetical protein